MILAFELDLDTDNFEDCLDEGRYADLVDADIALGQENDVNEVPTFLINETMIVGNQDYEMFVNAIEAEK